MEGKMKVKQGEAGKLWLSNGLSGRLYAAHSPYICVLICIYATCDPVVTVLRIAAFLTATLRPLCYDPRSGYREGHAGWPGKD